MNNILHIHSNQSVTWVRSDESGAEISRQELFDLSEIKDHEPNTPWIVLIPGHQVLLLSIQMPKSNLRALQKAIPYALEDQLATDIEELQFVIGRYQPNLPITVAVINKAVLSQQLAQLREYQIVPSIVIPDFLALKYVEKQWSIAVVNDWLLIRTDKDKGFSIPAEDASMVLPLTVDERNDSHPEGLLLFAEPTAPTVAWMNQVPIQRLSARDAFDYQGVIENPVFNLVSEQSRPHLKKSQKKSYWYVVEAISFFWLVTFIMTQSLIGFFLNRDISHQQQQMMGIEKTLYPHDPLSADPNLKITHELNNLLQNSHGTPMLRTLNKVAIKLRQYPVIHLQSIDFVNQMLTLKLTTDDLTMIEKLVQELNKQGLVVKQNQIDNSAKPITAELVIK